MCQQLFTCFSLDVGGRALEHFRTTWEDTGTECEKLDFRGATTLCATELSPTIGIISGEKDFLPKVSEGLSMVVC